MSVCGAAASRVMSGDSGIFSIGRFVRELVEAPGRRQRQRQVTPGAWRRAGPRGQHDGSRARVRAWRYYDEVRRLKGLTILGATARSASIPSTSPRAILSATESWR